MRLAIVSLAVILACPSAASAQAQYSIGDTLSPRVKVGSCALADQQLGPASKNVLKAEVHGTLGPENNFRLTSGPILYRDELPTALELFQDAAGTEPMPRGVLNIWFYAGILKVERDPAKPFTVVVDDSLSFPLGMPLLPAFQGEAPSVVPFNVVILPNGVEALMRARKARVEFLGKHEELDHHALDEFQGVVRLAICQRAGQAIVR